MTINKLVRKSTNIKFYQLLVYVYSSQSFDLSLSSASIHHFRRVSSKFGFPYRAEQFDKGQVTLTTGHFRLNSSPNYLLSPHSCSIINTQN